MKDKKTYIASDEIDLIELIKVCWKEKYLILIISFVCVAIFYLYSLSVKKSAEYQSQLTIKNPPINFLINFENFETTQMSKRFDEKNNSLSKVYFARFKQTILSKDNLINFIKQNNKISDFKDYITINNLNMREYLENRSGENGKNRFYFIFPKSLQGDIFLNDYIEYTKIISLNNFLDEIEVTIKNIIAIYERNLKIAEKIQLENPIIDSKELYYKGTKILSEEIINFKKLINLLNNENFYFDHVLESASKPQLSSRTLKNKALPTLGFFAGLLISLIVITIKNKFKKK